ncbi:hypothetical protein RhiirA4_474694 [Rhizophagus irregularis]|uniref:Uncharacterized protein n=1 Tax=Rhizophagus irregularis TaxID=588596 RepID=A0A2I1H8X0_9GLOM|nr:hypothetical protein RhiirA4_474694 [Rhizophagus irregularis]
MRVGKDKLQAFTRNTEIPILQPIFFEQTYDSNPTEFNLQQSDYDDVNDDFIDESIPVDSDDSIYREKQTGSQFVFNLKTR